MNTLIKNGLVITFIHEGYHSIKMKYADILVKDGVIEDIREEIRDAGAQVIDAQGLWVLPGLVDVAASSVSAVLCSGLLPDYSRKRWQGSMIHGRVLPLTEIAAQLLTEEEKDALARFALLSLADSGATTVAEMTHPAFAGAVARQAENLGLRAFVFPERTAAGYPMARHDGQYVQAARTGGAFAPGDALYSVETTSPEQYALARENKGTMLVRGAYCEYEKQVSHLSFGVSPVGKLNAEKLLTDHTVLAGGYDLDFYDRERLRTAGSSVAMSSVTAMQDGVPFPIVQNLRQDINTCLSTGYFGLSMLEEMKCAAFGGKYDSNATQFQASDAFYAATIAGAQALGQKLGRIEPSFAADLLLADPARLAPHNYPLIAWVYRAQNADIAQRIVAGKPLAQGCEQLKRCAPDAQRAADRVWREAQRFIL